jgi:autotransporter-associated beta strand protein
VTGGGASGGILKVGAGILRLDASNSFTGMIEVREGDFRASTLASNIFTGTPQLLISGGNVHIFGTPAATQTFGAVTVTKGSTTGSAANSTIAAPSFTFDVNTPDSVSIDTCLTNAGGASPLVKNLGGSVTLSHALSYTGSTTVNAGTLSLGTDLTTSPSVTVTGGRLELRVTATPNRVIKTSNLSISGGGQVDLQHNKLIVSGGNIGTPTAGDYDGITGWIQDGRNGGTWDGPGIMTSQSAADTALTGLGVASATAGRVFAGQTLNAGDVMVMYTYVGDATLDGIIDGDDYAAIDAGFSASSSGYANGDFDYNGRINADDYFLIDRNYSSQPGPILPGPLAEVGGVTAVPEPTSLSVLTLISAAMLGRRRRGKN